VNYPFNTQGYGFLEKKKNLILLAIVIVMLPQQTPIIEEINKLEF